jgi:hypothetical protein
MSEFARALAVEQRKRLVGSLMDHLEKRVYPHLPVDERNALRTKVMQSVGAYHDFILDVLKASVSDGMVGNDAALEILQQIHAGQAALRRDIDSLMA